MDWAFAPGGSAYLARWDNRSAPGPTKEIHRQQLPVVAVDPHPGGSVHNSGSSQNHNPLELGECRIRAGKDKVVGFGLGRQQAIKGIPVRHLP